MLTHIGDKLKLCRMTKLSVLNFPLPAFLHILNENQLCRPIEFVNIQYAGSRDFNLV